MNRGARVLIGTLLGAFFSAAAFAQESGVYLGGALGQAKFKEWCDVSGAPAGFVLTACDDKDSAWKLFGGYRFNRYVAIEATYVDWGDATATVGGPTAISAEQQSMGVAAVGSLGLGPQFSVFGKLGFLRTEQKIRRASATQTTTVEGDETELHYGLGVKYHFTANWAARAEWERTEKLEVEMLSIGAEFRF
jgi:OOP family OmpA-OmpF porin